MCSHGFIDFFLIFNILSHHYHSYWAFTTCQALYLGLLNPFISLNPPTNEVYSSVYSESIEQKILPLACGHQLLETFRTPSQVCLCPKPGVLPTLSFRFIMSCVWAFLKWNHLKLTQMLALPHSAFLAFLTPICSLQELSEWNVNVSYLLPSSFWRPAIPRPDGHSALSWGICSEIFIQYLMFTYKPQYKLYQN